MDYKEASLVHELLFPSLTPTLASSSLPALTGRSCSSRWFLCHFGQSLLHVAQVVVGYFMMLAVMSYNTWIFFGVVLGSGVGYYLAYPLLNMT